MSISHTSLDTKPLTTLEKQEDSKEKTANNPPGFFAEYEKTWGENMKNVPHYKFFGRPLYKILGGHKYPLFSVPLTFAAMDYIFHQVLPKLLSKRKFTSDTLTYNLYSNLIWVAVGLPIAFYKYSKQNDYAFFTSIQSIGQEMLKDEKYHRNNIRFRMI